MYEVYIKLMYELEYRKHTIEELKEIKKILEQYNGKTLEVKLKRIKEENGISYKKEKNNEDN